MVRTRFAPSPTGYIHIGSIRTALYSYALAKKRNGKFILRIEDTDKKREMEDGTRDIIVSLKVFGLKFDEGPEIGGDYGPYIQSKRLKIYQQKAQELIEKGKAYYCFCSEERLVKLREKQQKEKKQSKYDRKCRNIDIDEAKSRIEKGEKYVIRLKVPEGQKVVLDDVLLGKVSWNSDDVDDQVLLKSDGFPTYHLAVVVDDVVMKITHITRGIEWLSSVPKHILLYDVFDFKFPVTAHMPVILDPSGGGKLSKRKGVVAVKDFLEQGYLPEAILNFLMLLGWAPKDDREIFSLTEFVKEFSLDRLNKASPVFDRQKLLWFNGEYIRSYSKKLFAKKVLLWAKKYYKDKEMLQSVTNDKGLVKKLELIQERVSLLSKIPDSIRFFYKRLDTPDPTSIKGVKRYKKEDYKNATHEYFRIIDSYPNSSKWKHEVWEKDIRALAEKYDWKHADMFMLIRLAICGSSISPPLFESMVILGKKEILERLKS